jgi:glycosyltransferase involved in cell wall biosynthesis
MERGVDHQAFSPQYRDRRDDDGKIVVGYVGRLSAEKQVRRFAEVANALARANLHNTKIVFVGQGSERDWLAANVQNAEFSGVLHGAELARAYERLRQPRHGPSQRVRQLPLWLAISPRQLHHP